MPDLGRALAALYARAPMGMRLGLDAMREACARAGNPERAFAAVHVAGTNGKGSTSAMIEAIAREDGRRTGLYTSPHLVRFAERIRLGGEPLDDDALAVALDDALRLGPELSFFEAATLAAFLAFARAEVDLAVVEVGIGGRLDATNVLPPPRCAAITRIARDHEDKLGDTLEQIAREKAAIAKPGTPVVLGPLEGSVRAAATSVVLGAGGTVIDAPRDLDVGPLALGGAHQRENAAVADAVARVLGLTEGARRRALSRVTWPGRMERIDHPSGPYLLDGAHNPDGLLALGRALAETVPAAIVFGALADKAWAPMLDALATFGRDVARVYVAPEGRAPVPPETLAAYLPGDAAPSLDAALRRAREVAGPEGLVVVCGSLYLVGAARAHLCDLPRDPAVGL